MERPPDDRPRIWALVDCACFYCSCERLFRPDLIGRPVAVLSNNDGCVVSLTPEAKALGFQRGEVFFKSRRRLQEAGVAVFSSNYALYGDISRRVTLAMESVAPDVRPYSIDEAFIPFSGALAAQAAEAGRALTERVGRWVGVPVRVGLGVTRTLAKLANRWAKEQGPVLDLTADERRLDELLARTAAEDVWGIGRRLAVKLERLGVKTAEDLRAFDPLRARRLFGVTVQRTVMELGGLPSADDDLDPTPRKTLVSSRSFGRRISELEDLSQALAARCAQAGERLRREELLAGRLSIFIGTGRVDDEPFEAGATARLPWPTSSTLEFVKAARTALERAYQPGRRYGRAGVMLLELSEKKPDRLFPPAPAAVRSEALMRSLDLINARHGRETIKFSAQGPAEPVWGLRRDRLSEVSTTAWAELPTAKA
ncbi:MAG: Y-family DNA polymerase [Deltaproteobacteria bacterium]|jgi:DNA polymerase V|nr:Y-family DNA polymerase [Deltaproteobacteria bacterium]